MVATSFAHAREAFAQLCERAAEDGETAVITRDKNRNVALISEERLEKLKELEREAAHQAKLDRGRAEIANGYGIIKTLEELEAMVPDGE